MALDAAATAAPPTTEGEVSFTWAPAGRPCKTWYKIIGDLDNATQPALIGLHGGPGTGHEYLNPLSDLWASHGIPIVLYDQIGCARSTRFQDKPGDASFWTFDMFIAELDNLIDALALRKRGFSVIGQSWGGMLGSEYASRRPVGLKKLINAGGPSSLRLMTEGEKPMLAALPEDVRRTIEGCLEKGDYESDEFEAASAAFYVRHFCRLDPFPNEVMQGMGHLKEDPTAYVTMNGPCEFVLTGVLKEWDGGKTAAHKIEVDTLLINGEYDQSSDLCMAPWFKRQPRVRWVTLAGAAHMTHYEQREKFMQLCGDFLVDEEEQGEKA